MQRIQRLSCRFLGISIFFIVLVHLSGGSPAGDRFSNSPVIELIQDDHKDRLTIMVEGREALVFQYAAWRDLPHYWPLNSPSGKNMLVQQTDPYPHHRSFWFADTVRLEQGRQVSTYNALYTGQKIGKNVKTGEALYGPPFKDHIRHVSFSSLESEADEAEIVSHLVWEMDGEAPVLEEKRTLLVFALRGGEYLLDITFVLTAAFGDVEFVSDDVHYAWPYLRMHPRFNGDNGGVITSDSGRSGQEDTNMQAARWIDYSNTIGDKTEGLAVFQWPDEHEHRWLTREYGCFGPRRPDAWSGKPFTLKKGESISQRVGILVHNGDVKTGRVAQRYADYIAGRW